MIDRGLPVVTQDADFDESERACRTTPSSGRETDSANGRQRAESLQQAGAGDGADASKDDDAAGVHPFGWTYMRPQRGPSACAGHRHYDPKPRV